VISADAAPPEGVDLCARRADALVAAAREEACGEAAVALKSNRSSLLLLSLPRCIFPLWQAFWGGSVFSPHVAPKIDRVQHSETHRFPSADATSTTRVPSRPYCNTQPGCGLVPPARLTHVHARAVGGTCHDKKAPLAKIRGGPRCDVLGLNTPAARAKLAEPPKSVLAEVGARRQLVAVPHERGQKPSLVDALLLGLVALAAD
jgi:hypothetical protein